MNWTANHTKLRDTLAQLYLERADALRISTQAGLQPTTISFYNKAINTWQEIITKAEAQDLLVTLIKQALGEFPKNSVLIEALDFFQNRETTSTGIDTTMATSEDINHQQTLLTTYRRNVAHYLKQQSALGDAFTPPGVTNGLFESRNHIQRIKQILRGWNVAVNDHPDDSDPV
jgi:hypothetical protein